MSSFFFLYNLTLICNDCRNCCIHFTPLAPGQPYIFDPPHPHLVQGSVAFYPFSDALQAINHSRQRIHRAALMANRQDVINVLGHEETCGVQATGECPEGTGPCGLCSQKWSGDRCGTGEGAVKKHIRKPFVYFTRTYLKTWCAFYRTTFISCDVSFNLLKWWKNLFLGSCICRRLVEPKPLRFTD